MTPALTELTEGRGGISPGNAVSADAARPNALPPLVWTVPDLDAWQDVHTCRACDGAGELIKTLRGGGYLFQAQVTARAGIAA